MEGDRLMVVEVSTEGPFTRGTPRPRFSGSEAGVKLFVGEDTLVWPRYDVAPDGQRLTDPSCRNASRPMNHKPLYFPTIL